MAIDRHYFPHACLCLQSIERYYPQHPDILVYHYGLTPKQVKKLGTFSKVRPVFFRDDLSYGISLMPSHRQMRVDPLIVTARYAIWSHTLSHYDKVLHLDVDTLVLGPLDSFFLRNEFTMIEEPFDAGLFDDANLPLGTALLKEDGIRFGSRQANGGVFLVPRHFRNPEHRDRLHALNKKYGSIVKWQDQSILNLLLFDQGLAPTEDYEFNYCVNMHAHYPKEFETANIKVLHFNDMIENDWMRLLLMRVGLSYCDRPGNVRKFSSVACRIYQYGKNRKLQKYLRILSKIIRKYV